MGIVILLLVFLLASWSEGRRHSGEFGHHHHHHEHQHRNQGAFGGGSEFGGGGHRGHRSGEEHHHGGGHRGHGSDEKHFNGGGHRGHGSGEEHFHGNGGEGHGHGGHRPHFHPQIPTRPPGEPAPQAPTIQVEPLIQAASCRCGISPRAQFSDIINTRIVGGVNAVANEFPWQVGLVLNGESKPFCGGSLLSSRTVLTASHCLTDIAKFKVIVGALDLSQGPSPASYTPISFERHPQFDEKTEDYDFAIITLGEPVDFSQAVAPICLTEQGNDDNRAAVVSGWGTTSHGGPQPNILQKVNVETMTNAKCSTPPNIYASGEITDRMICASGKNADSCQGDSGGPLVAQAGENFEQIGVVSFGVGCALASAPGVYARVSAARSWIESKVQGITCPR